MPQATSQTQPQNLAVQAYTLAQNFNGSEDTVNNFLRTMIRLEARMKASPLTENEYLRHAFNKANKPLETLDAFLDLAGEFYKTLEFDTQSALKASGAHIQHSPLVFIQTGDGQLNKNPNNKAESSYEIKPDNRLATLVRLLQQEGIAGHKIYGDDLCVIYGKQDERMMRSAPYNIIQIPKLNAEIAVCDQVGEITFVKRGNCAPQVWNYLNKDELKTRDDILPVPKNNQTQWWQDISTFIATTAPEKVKKINLKKWSTQERPIDKSQVDATLIEHYKAQGWRLSSSSKEPSSDIKGSYIIKDGDPNLIGKTASTLNIMAYRGNVRGYPKKSTIFQISDDLGIGMVTKDKLDETLWAHYEKHRWRLSVGSEEPGSGKKGSYVIKDGHPDVIGKKYLN